MISQERDCRGQASAYKFLSPVFSTQEAPVRRTYKSRREVQVED